MMKKLLLVCTTFFAFNFSGHAQIVDTLTYFYKKQKYKAPVPGPGVQHPIYKSAAGTVMNTGFTHVGSVFKNRSAIQITGLEARVSIPNEVPSQNGNVPTRLYLANVNAQGLPVFPLLDSTNLLYSFAKYATGVIHPGQVVGGVLAHGTKTVTGDFAVLIRCTSLQEGDSVFVFRTSGHHANSANPNPLLKFGEGRGVIRNQGQFSKTTDYNHPYFGPGTDYEFCVAPRVKYDLEISQIENNVQYGACCFQAFTNTNTSTSAWTNPQFNFNEFYFHLQPFNNLFPSGTFTNSLIWNIGDGSPDTYPLPGTDLVPLGAFGGDCNKFYEGTIIGDFKKMAPETPVTSHTAQITFTSSTVWCYGDTLGSSIKEITNLSHVKVYPNPTVDKVIVSGLIGKNTITLYNMFGQQVFIQQADKTEISVDLSRFAIGNYLLRIADANNDTRVVKLVKE